MDKRALIRQRLWQLRGALNALEVLIGECAEGEVATPPQKRAERALPAAFEAFWAHYPKKVGKMAALRAWTANVATEGQDAVVEALRRQLGQPDWVREGGKYIPHPTTWLNQHRWLDEVKGGGGNDSGKYGGLGEVL